MQLPWNHEHVREILGDLSFQIDGTYVLHLGATWAHFREPEDPVVFGPYRPSLVLASDLVVLSDGDYD